MKCGFRFQVDKEVNFVYWLQSITNWNWYFNSKEYQFYQELTGEFDNKEKLILKKFANFLKPPEIYKIFSNYRKRGYLWLWGRYARIPITSSREKRYWQRVKSTMLQKFEILWSEHLPLLRDWQIRLENHDFLSTNKGLTKVEKFFNNFLDQSIVIQLCVNHQKNFPSGHVKREFPNLILLNLSSVRKSEFDKVISILNHELSHLIEYNSPKNELLSHSISKLIEPKKIQQQNPSWRHLISESIITSIAGRNFSYLDRKLKLINDFNQNHWNNEIGRQILQTAYEISKVTERYLDQGKEMDQEYIDYVVITMLS
ncbi:MAG TPA: hypothetical protein ENN31_01130 [Candidatus Vogelbacteria bacterium]|nr:hypothetical protein [Candidatus Vogelbacteria bacterium]